MDEHEPATLEDLAALYGRGQAEFEVLRQVFAWAGSYAAAEEWLQTPIESMESSSPLELMEDGHTDLVLAHLRRIGVGGFA
jgi:uncharacterized protein (DUF2384 family)